MSKIFISDLQGRIIEIKITNDQTVIFDISKYSPGAYIISVCIDGRLYVEKILCNY